MTSPPGGTNFAGKTNVAPSVGWNGSLDSQLIRPRQGVLLEAPHNGLELVEVGEVAIDRGELNGAHGIDAGEAALGQLADPPGLDLPAFPAHLGGDPGGHGLELLIADRPSAGSPGETAQELLAVEGLAASISLDHANLGLLRAFIGGEAFAAGIALSAPADYVP
jgi:hypothetical protein